MTVEKIKNYLGPKPAVFCYSFLYDRIHRGTFPTVRSIKEFLKKVIKHDESLLRDLSLPYYQYEERHEAWVKQAKEIFLFIENEK